VINEAFRDIEQLEADLWEAADSLCASSKLTSSDHFMPVLVGVNGYVERPRPDPRTQISPADP
jgi:hypothetical protein